MKASVRDEGSIVMFTPEDTEAREWLAEFEQDDWQWFGRALAIEHRYANGFIAVFVDEGGEVS